MKSTTLELVSLQASKITIWLGNRYQFSTQQPDYEVRNMTDVIGRSKRQTLVESLLLKHPELEPQIEGHGPEGWDELIADALFEIGKLSIATGVIIKIAQIKEQFGGLCLYTDIDETPATDCDVGGEIPSPNYFHQGVIAGVRDRVHQIVDVAAGSAAKVCVRCGQQATRKMGFYQFCSEHSSAYS